MEKRVENLTEKVKKYFTFYILGLISGANKKTCKEMASILKISHDFVYSFLVRAKIFALVILNLQYQLIRKYHKDKAGWFILDDTLISKPFCKKIIGAFDMFNHVLRRNDRGFCIVVLIWTNGLVSVPISFEWYFAKDLVGKKNFKSKSEVAKALILSTYKKVPFSYLLADAHYSTITVLKGLIPFLNQLEINFIMKIPNNRKITSCNEGIYELVRNQPGLRLTRNQRSAKILAIYYGEELYFSINKREDGKGGYTYIYLVSNMDLPAKEYSIIYHKRWHIEVVFRTLKKTLGLNDCMCRGIEKQKAHFLATFCGYTFLQNVKFKEKLEHPEEARRYLLKLKSSEVEYRISSLYENFSYVA